MAWMISEDLLDPQQRDFVYNQDIDSKNIWIKGFAGSGKSVLLAHTVRKIQKKTSNFVIVVFTQSMVDMFNTGLKEAGLSASVITIYKFLGNGRSYDYILCDEVQDLTPSMLGAMKNRAKHVIVAGDSHQSIYEKDPQYQEQTVEPEQIGTLLNACDFELSIIHRLSKSIIGAVERLLPHIRISSSRKDLTKKDVSIRVAKGESQLDEVKYAILQAKNAVNTGCSAAVLFPTTKHILNFANLALQAQGKPEWQLVLNKYKRPDFHNMNTYLAKNGIPLEYIGSGYGSLEQARVHHRIVLMTYHSAKGLDFDNVLIPFASKNLWICSKEELAKSLFMVAMTRSRENLYITYSGSISSYVEPFSNQCSNLLISNILTESSAQNTNNEYGF